MKTVIAAMALTLLSSGTALAHAHLEIAVPAADATVSAPAQLELRFSETVEPRFTGVAITGPNDAAVPVGKASLAIGDGTVLDVPLTGPVPSGNYVVAWHALASDGHRTNGTYSFTVK